MTINRNDMIAHHMEIHDSLARNASYQAWMGNLDTRKHGMNTDPEDDASQAEAARVDAARTASMTPEEAREYRARVKALRLGREVQHAKAALHNHFVDQDFPTKVAQARLGLEIRASNKQEATTESIALDIEAMQDVLTVVDEIACTFNETVAGEALKLLGIVHDTVEFTLQFTHDPAVEANLQALILLKRSLAEVEHDAGQRGRFSPHAWCIQF